MSNGKGQLPETKEHLDRIKHQVGDHLGSETPTPPKHEGPNDEGKPKVADDDVYLEDVQ